MHKKQPKQIAGHDLLPGAIIKDNLFVPDIDYGIPFGIICGSRPGPVLLLTAGIHNAEFVGIQAAIELSRELVPEDLSGTVIIVPLANRSGFEHRTMSLIHEDGKNLNRVFPGNLNGTESERIAFLLFHTLILEADAYIDLHSGDGFEELTPYVYFVGDTACEAESAAMAACINTEHCVRSRCKTGGAYNLASVNGIPSILIERGQLSLFPRHQIEADKEDVRNIMRSLGMLPGNPRTYPKQQLTETELSAPAGGCWYPELHAGNCFSAGDLLGTIRDYFGQTICCVRAPENGFLLHQCASLNIIEDGPMLSYGTCLPADTDDPVAEINVLNRLQKD